MDETSTKILSVIASKIKAHGDKNHMKLILALCECIEPHVRKEKHLPAGVRQVFRTYKNWANGLIVPDEELNRLANLVKSRRREQYPFMMGEYDGEDSSEKWITIAVSHMVNSYLFPNTELPTKTIASVHNAYFCASKDKSEFLEIMYCFSFFASVIPFIITFVLYCTNDKYFMIFEFSVLVSMFLLWSAYNKRQERCSSSYYEEMCQVSRKRCLVIVKKHLDCSPLAYRQRLV